MAILQEAIVCHSHFWNISEIDSNKKNDETGAVTCVTSFMLSCYFVGTYTVSSTDEKFQLNCKCWAVNICIFYTVAENVLWKGVSKLTTGFTWNLKIQET